MSELWGAVPQVWPGGRVVDPPPESKPTEPSVSANVAAAANVKTEAPDGQDEPEAPSLAGDSAPSESTVLHRTTSGPESIDVEPSKSPATHNSQTVFSEPSNDQIERLKAALDDDAERAREPSRQLATNDVRARVESLLQRSRNLFDLGQLREARHTAKIAHDLGDSAKLDYSPDEERPIDLVQRIDEQLKETEQTDAETIVSSEEQKPVPTANTELPSKSQPVPETDTNSKAKRDWGLSVFRRDRKNASSEQTKPTAAPPTTPGSPAETSLVRLGLEVENAESDQAVVQANRSLTLRGQKSNDETRQHDSATVALATSERPNRAYESTEDAFDGTDERPSMETVSHQTIWPPEITDTPRMVIEETTPPPSDAEEVKPLRPFRDVAGQISPTSEPVRIETCSRFNAGWIAGLSFFGICAAMAWFWYRRGAT